MEVNFRRSFTKWLIRSRSIWRRGPASVDTIRCLERLPNLIHLKLNEWEIGSLKKICIMSRILFVNSNQSTYYVTWKWASIFIFKQYVFFLIEDNTIILLLSVTILSTSKEAFSLYRFLLILLFENFSYCLIVRTH